MAFLEVIKGERIGEHVLFLGAVTIIGRRKENDIVIEDPSVSRRHAEIARRGDNYYLRDLTSRNGTFVNGILVQQEKSLKEGDVVVIGATAFQFRQIDNVIRDFAPDTSVDLRICDVNKLSDQWYAACDLIWKCASTARLVFVPLIGENELFVRLQKTDPDVCAKLGMGFHHLVVLDLAKGMTQHGQFELSKFYEHALRVIEAAFQIPSMESYHEQEMMQILQDEGKSLICLLNAHLLSSSERKRIRSLTQDKHHAVIAFQRGQSWGEPRKPDDTVVQDFDDCGSVSDF